MATERVLVAGGGWAGLAAAVELAQRGVPVTLFESARQLGGRARAVAWGDEPVDNGAHLLVGAYRQFLRLLAVVGVDADAALARLPLRLRVDGAAGPLELAAPRLPAPLHLLAALGSLRGVGAADRGRALALAVRLAAGHGGTVPDLDVRAWLRRCGQSQRLCVALWEPLCLATLNTRAQEASARVFVRVLHDSFARRRADSDLLLPRTDLGALFPDPARAFIESRGGRVLTGRRVEALLVEHGRLAGLRVDGERVGATHAVLAVPVDAARRLLAPHPALAAVAADLTALRPSPICTVYLRYPPSVRLRGHFSGWYDGLTQWLLDRAVCGQPGLMAAVVSGPGGHMELGRQALAARVADELARRLGWPAPVDTFVVRERRATFRCAVDSDRLRPGAATAVAGLWLAGDYTATGYPATLEGAVRSGIQCAVHIVSSPLDGPRPDQQ